MSDVFRRIVKNLCLGIGRFTRHTYRHALPTLPPYPARFRFAAAYVRKIDVLWIPMGWRGALWLMVGGCSAAQPYRANTLIVKSVGMLHGASAEYMSLSVNVKYTILTQPSTGLVRRGEGLK